MIEGLTLKYDVSQALEKEGAVLVRTIMKALKIPKTCEKRAACIMLRSCNGCLKRRPYGWQTPLTWCGHLYPWLQRIGGQHCF